MSFMQYCVIEADYNSGCLLRTDERKTVDLFF
jgi:hypothetical protein